MYVTNFKEKIKLYLQSNPSLTYDQFGILLLIDNLYQDIPGDINMFRRMYAHFDPDMIQNPNHGVTFLEIARKKESVRQAKERLNAYIDAKYNYLGKSKTYEQNMERFCLHCRTATSVLDEILAISDLPREILEVLRESDEVRRCRDFYELLRLYRSARGERLRYEILRKIGIIVMLSRIENSYNILEMDYAIEKIARVFHKGLGLTEGKRENIYLWVDENEDIQYSEDRRRAAILYQESVRRRNSAALPKHSMQVFEHRNHTTKFGREILHAEFRSKLRSKGIVSYTSFVEKIIRKNLEFPNQVHDVLGARLVVRTEDEITPLIRNLQTFLGGSSTRKKEKNTLHKFGKRTLSKYSGSDYFVWKAVYDITLPHPALARLAAVFRRAEDVKHIESVTNSFLDVVVEVQIQELKSYLLSIAKGSPTDHSLLKTTQVRKNSFYKLFPREIYEKELIRLRKQILEGSVSQKQPYSFSSSIVSSSSSS